MMKLNRYLPVLVFAGFAVASPALARSAVTTGQINLLSGPEASYAALSVLEAGARVDLVWCGLRGDWCLVDRLGRRGCVPLATLKLKSAGKPMVSADGGTGNGNNSSGGDLARDAGGNGGSGGGDSGKGAVYAVHEGPSNAGQPDHPVISKGPVFSAQ